MRLAAVLSSTFPFLAKEAGPASHNNNKRYRRHPTSSNIMMNNYSTNSSLQTVLRLFTFVMLFIMVWSTDRTMASLSSGQPHLTETCAHDSCTDDRQGFEAIKWLHRQLDDDADGNVDVAESDDFLRDELKFDSGANERHKAFHGEDKHISVDELWNYWRISEVHNWTVQEAVEWLITAVELPQYSESFRKNHINGSSLPRLTSSSPFMISVLGIKDPIHRQRLALKAMDAVLFGPPKHNNFVKDIVLAMSLLLAMGGCWFAFVQHRYSQTHLKRMVKDMESLQKAEEQLHDLQSKLDQARHEQEAAKSEKKSLEELLNQQKENDKFNHNRDSPLSDDSSRVNNLEQELKETREALERAERQLDIANMHWSPPQALHQWLQTTYDLELKAYNTKRHQAEMQLASAKEWCEKLRKRRSTFMGSFKVAHGSAIDDVENRIASARQALSEVTLTLQERLHRWRQIEHICGFSIVNSSAKRSDSDG